MRDVAVACSIIIIVMVGFNLALTKECVDRGRPRVDIQFTPRTD